MCNAPIQLTTGGVVRRVQCGHCQSCARRRATSWTLRLLMEMQDHALTDFVTLTYRPDTRPDMLDTEHFDQFMRRLRKSTPTNVRYFCCGEYGGKTGHPHWHVLLFGHRFPERGLCHIAQWPHGHAFNGEVERKSAQYVCRYTLKSADKNSKKQVIRMSRRPGIGLSQLRKIAMWLAAKRPDMEYYPPVMAYQQKTYWLDRRAYEACVNAYLNAGGVLTYDVAPNNELLDNSIRSLPVDAVVRELQRATHGKI